MAHSHTYYTYTYTTTPATLVVSATMQNCPSGHTNCQVASSSTATCFQVTNNVANELTTSSDEYTLTHTHTFTKQTVTAGGSAAPLVVYDYSLKNPCGTYTLMSSTGADALATTTLTIGSESGTTGAAIDNGDGTHYHEYTYVKATASIRVLTLGNCPAAHANCTAASYTSAATAFIEYALGTDDTDDAENTVTPVVTTVAASSTDYDSSQLNGSYTETLESVYFEWGTVSGSLIYYTVLQAAATPFNQTISQLSRNTTYYFRAVGIDSEGTYYYGSELNFTTSAGTPRTSDYKMIVQTYKRGPLSPISLPVFLAECKAWTYDGGLIETQWSNNGYATFSAIPNDLPVYVTARWGSNYIREDNIYCSSYPAVANFVSNTHVQNTDETCYGMRSQDDAPSSPANGAVYLDTNA